MSASGKCAQSIAAGLPAQARAGGPAGVELAETVLHLFAGRRKYHNFPRRLGHGCVGESVIFRISAEGTADGAKAIFRPTAQGRFSTDGARRLFDGAKRFLDPATDRVGNPYGAIEQDRISNSGT